MTLQEDKFKFVSTVAGLETSGSQSGNSNSRRTLRKIKFNLGARKMSYLTDGGDQLAPLSQQHDVKHDGHDYVSASVAEGYSSTKISLNAEADDEDSLLHPKSKRRKNNLCQENKYASSFKSDAAVSCLESYCTRQPFPLSLRRRRLLLRRGKAIGGFIFLMMLLLVLVQLWSSPSFSSTCSAANDDNDCSWYQRHPISFRGNQHKEAVNRSLHGISHYLALFGGASREGQTLSSSSRTSERILAESSQAFRYPQLVIAGKMTVAEGPCNIAQLNLKTNSWSLTERIQLSLYNSYSGGEVYSLLANYTFEPPRGNDDDDNFLESRRHRKQYGSGELIVVGAFDTTYRNSQVTYCSVGEWDGLQLSKVGEGLCNSALSKGMKITTAALAGPQDVYVAGSFQTQVWNGDRHEFVKIFNIAHFNAVEQVWLPLNVGQITCSWCTVTVLALAWDSKKRQLHVAGKFNAIDGKNVPAGLAIYDWDSGHLVAHPGGGLVMKNKTQDGVGTALQLDQERGVLYVMGSFERLTATSEVCLGLAAYEIHTNKWTCLADAAHTVLPTGGGNMLLTDYGLMVAGKTTSSTTWPDNARPYTIALLKTTLKEPKKHKVSTGKGEDEDEEDDEQGPKHDFNWSWLPGFNGHDEPLHALSNGFGDYDGTVFIAGDNLVAKWSYHQYTGSDSDSKPSPHNRGLSSTSSSSQPQMVPVTENLSEGHVRGAIMAISQMMPEVESDSPPRDHINLTFIIVCVAAGCVIGMVGAILCNRGNFPFLGNDAHLKGISLDTLTYSALENTNITDAYQRAMQTRYVQHPHLLTIIDPQEIFLQRIIGEGTFGRVWSAKWRSASVAVKEFVFAQAAVMGKSSMQQEIVEEIIGEAGMMAILRHPNVLQLFGCSLTAQAIWIVSELCSLGSLRQLLDDNERTLSIGNRLNLALQVAEGMTYLHNQDPPIIHRDLKSHNIFVHETFTESQTPEDPPKKRKRSWMKNGSSGKENKNDSNSSSTSAPTHTFGKPEKMVSHSTLVAKIGDWGSARATLSGSRTMTHGVGTACWLAPEVIKHARSSKYSDVYGYGIVLWELATREEVYQGLETTQIIAKVANESLRPPVPQSCRWKDIMVQCWEENPNDRLEFGEIVKDLNSLSSDLEKEDGQLQEDDQLQLSLEEDREGDFHGSTKEEDLLPSAIKEDQKEDDQLQSSQELSKPKRTTPLSEGTMELLAKLIGANGEANERIDNPEEEKDQLITPRKQVTEQVDCN